MPIRPRLARALAAAGLAAATLLTGLAGQASAFEPPRPLPDYRPAFVTETGPRPWTDCLWASGAMLLDKWTSGDIQLSRQTLRWLSGDLQGGSALANLRVSYASIGINLVYSPDGGARITWPMLLSRLEQGAGAVLLGDDSKLPRWYGRWDVTFWKATGDKDNHAVYIERYDRRRGRVWLMDPLASGDWHGEWISVAALRRYAWTQHGALSVAVTPTAAPAPFAGVTMGAPTASVTAANLDVAWPVKAPAGWRFPGVDVTAEFTPAPDPLSAAALGLAASSFSAAGEPLPAPTATIAATGLHATVPVPVDPGAYQATITVTDRRFGRVVARSVGTAVFVPGPRSAALRLQASSVEVAAGATIPVNVAVANTGQVTWAEVASTLGAPAAFPRATRLVARWVPVDVPTPSAPLPGAGDAAASSLDVTRGGSTDTASGPGGPEIPNPVAISSLSLSPGDLIRIGGSLVTPVTSGTWALVVDVVDDVDGSFAALGSAPAVEIFHVLSPQMVRGSI